MTKLLPRLAALPAAAAAFVLGAAVAPVHAESLASAASSAGSASVGSLSALLEGSSASSTGNRKTAMAGDWQVLAVLDAADRPGQLGVELQRLDDPARTVRVWMPRRASAPAVGARVTVHERDWGLAFAHGGGATFFVALDDAHRGDLALRPVAL